MTLQGLCDAYKYKDGKSLFTVAKYNVQDSYVTWMLFKKEKILDFISGLANIARIPLEEVYLYGQQQRIKSMIYFDSLRNNYVYENINYLYLKTENYLGAIVFQPEIGAYYDSFIFDFASLYPSVIQCKNIDYTTYACEDVKNNIISINDYNDIHVQEHRGCKHSQGDKKDELSKRVICSDTHEYFLKEEIFGLGIMPRMVKELIEKRKKIKEEKNEMEVQYKKVKYSSNYD